MFNMADLVDSVVRNINQDIYEKSSDRIKKFIEDNGSFLTFDSDGDSYIIRFGSFRLWSSGDDSRPTKLNGDHTPLFEFVRQQTKYLLDIFSAGIKLS